MRWDEIASLKLAVTNTKYVRKREDRRFALIMWRIFVTEGEKQKHCRTAMCSVNGDSSLLKIAGKLESQVQKSILDYLVKYVKYLSAVLFLSYLTLPIPIFDTYIRTKTVALAPVRRRWRLQDSPYIHPHTLTHIQSLDLAW